jgi:non-canonical (house-cleaning) NTP pyrophosphatase
MAVRAAVARVAAIDPAWAKIKIVARPVEISAPAMPLTDEELMKGARERALAVCAVLQKQKLVADLYVGLEGGFHSIEIDGRTHTFLRGWAYVTDGLADVRADDGGDGGRSPNPRAEPGEHTSGSQSQMTLTGSWSSQATLADSLIPGRGCFGATPSIAVPESIRKAVIEGQRELGIVIDEVAGARDVRSRQGAWGVLSRDLVTRSLSFEVALIAAFAPFYNAALYT